MRKAEFNGMMQKTLRKVDLASMQNSLEVRVPFLQKKFIDAVMQIDPMLSYGGGKKKQVLKNLIVEEFPEMPDDNIKRGFSIPLTQWIKEHLRSVFEEKLLSGKYTQFGFDRVPWRRCFVHILMAKRILNGHYLLCIPLQDFSFKL